MNRQRSTVAKKAVPALGKPLRLQPSRAHTSKRRYNRKKAKTAWRQLASEHTI